MHDVTFRLVEDMLYDLCDPSDNTPPGGVK